MATSFARIEVHAAKCQAVICASISGARSKTQRRLQVTRRAVYSCVFPHFLQIIADADNCEKSYSQLSGNLTSLRSPTYRECILFI